MTKTMTFILLALALLAPASTALAYIGPGAGMSVVGSLLTILATIFVAIGAIIFWPVRKLMQRRKARRNSVVSADAVNVDTVKTGTVKTGTIKSGTVKTAPDSTPDGS